MLQDCCSLIIIIIIIIIIIPVITCMHGIYNYIPETNHVSTVYSVAAVLYLQSVLHVMLLRPVKYVFVLLHQHFPQCVCAVTNMALFCSSLTTCFPGALSERF